MNTKSDSTNISTAEIRRAAENVLSLIEERFGDNVEVSKDYYWSIDPIAAFDVTNDPQPTVGQLGDDIESTRSPTGHLWHDLDHFLGLLTYISSLDRSGN